MAVKAQRGANRPAFMPVHRDHTADRLLSRWGIVLAGGEGSRMRPLIKNWLGEERPKQYCTFAGSRSMYQHTLDRARCVVPEKQVVSVIGQGHRKFLSDSIHGSSHGPVLEQPENLGTAPGIFLPAAYVLAQDPEATLLILPADHFVHPEDRFCEIILCAFALAETHCGMIILIGAIPDRPETDYGWIAPGNKQGDVHNHSWHEAVHVMYFREKPARSAARTMFQQGCLWNTMVMTVKAKTLWALGRKCLPGMMCQFDAFLMVLRAVREGRLAPAYEASALANLYNELPSADFSKDILQNICNQSMVMRMEGVNWCDWGRPQRVNGTLAGLGRRPLFPKDYLEPY